MMSAWSSILFVNAAEQLLRREPAIVALLPKSVTGSLPDVDDTAFSGDALERRGLLNFVTPSFSHFDRSHVVNNMIMFTAVSPALEQQIGPAALFFLYIGCGAAGWWFTKTITLRSCGAELWTEAGKFQQSVGASPSTYGLCAAASLLLAGEAEIILPGQWAEQSAPVSGAVCSLSFLSTTAAVYLLPTLARHNWTLSQKLRETVFTDIPLMLTSAAISNWCCQSSIDEPNTNANTSESAFSFLCSSLTAPLRTPVTATTFLAAYHLKTFFHSRLPWRKRDSECSGADHLCHFGGTLFGTLFAAALMSTSFVSEKAVISSSLGSVMPQAWSVVCTCLVYLACQCFAEPRM